MIVVAGSVKIKPEAREQASEAARRMIEATLAEAGCHAYRFSFDVADPTLVHVFEEWENDEALTRHFQTPHMAEFQAALPSLLAGPPSFMRYEVGAVSKLM